MLPPQMLEAHEWSSQQRERYTHLLHRRRALRGVCGTAPDASTARVTKGCVGLCQMLAEIRDQHPDLEIADTAATCEDSARQVATSSRGMISTRQRMIELSARVDHPLLQ